MSLEEINGKEEKTYPDSSQESADEAECSLGWRHGRDLLRKPHALDGFIQKGGDVLSGFLSLGHLLHDAAGSNR